VIPISKPLIGEVEKKAVMDVLESGLLVQGAVTAALEQRFAEIVGVDHAVATSSGTTALHLALLAHGIGTGDEVITTPFTFIASVNAILYVGAIPRFVDIDPGTFNLDAGRIESAITSRTRAILPVHLYGQPAEMDGVMALAKKHDLVVIEDCAQSIGAEYRGKQTGSFGTGAFSLYATKNVMSGEGGMITTSDADLARRCRLLREHGSPKRYHHEILGFNFRMTDLHAAIGVAQIGRLDEFTDARRANAKKLTASITTLETPAEHAHVGHVYHQYTVRVPIGGTPRKGKSRDEVVAYLGDNGIGCGVFYPIPAHRQEHLRHLAAGIAPLPLAEAAAESVLSLPVHPGLADSDLDRVIDVVNAL
jgi:perosamine synthetase